MGQLSVKWNRNDLRIVRQGLENLRAEIPKVGRNRIFQKLRKLVIRMKRYPSRPPNSTYVRTFRLQKSWSIRRKGNMGWTIFNRASNRGRMYAQWVIGDAFGMRQAKIHVGRWKILRAEMEKILKELPKVAAESVHLAVRTKGWKAA